MVEVSGLASQKSLFAKYKDRQHVLVHHSVDRATIPKYQSNPGILRSIARRFWELRRIVGRRIRGRLLVNISRTSGRTQTLCPGRRRSRDGAANSAYAPFGGQTRQTPKMADLER